MRKSSSVDYYKQQATKLQSFLLVGGIKLKRSHALEAIARINNHDGFHSLCFSNSRAQKPDDAIEDVTKWLKKIRDSDVWDLMGDIVLALDTRNGLYAAVKYEEEIVAVYLSRSKGPSYKAYYEGDPYATHCPAQILNLLTPTETPSVLVWREACWINALRDRMIEDGDREIEFAPWVLLSAMRALEGLKPKFAAATGVKSLSFDISDGKVVKSVKATRDWLAGVSYMDLSTETPLNQAEHLLRPGQPWKWLEFGKAPFRLWLLVAEDGGFITWTANPFHMHGSFAGLDWSEPQRSIFATSGDGANALLEKSARESLHAGPATFDRLYSSVLAGDFDSVFSL